VDIPGVRTQGIGLGRKNLRCSLKKGAKRQNYDHSIDYDSTSGLKKQEKFSKITEFFKNIFLKPIDKMKINSYNCFC